MAVGEEFKGMSKKEVLDKLGPPRAKSTDREYRSQYTSGVIVLGNRSSPSRFRKCEREHWYYSGVPDERYNISLFFQRERVVDIAYSLTDDSAG